LLHFDAIFGIICPMKKAIKKQQKLIDYSQLNTVECLAIIAQKETQLNDQDALILEQNNCLLEQDSRLLEQNNRLKEHKNYIRILEEYLRLAKIQKFAARSEKLPFQLDLFDEVELEATLSDLQEQLPADEPVKPRAQKRQRGFCDSLNRKRIELVLTESEKAGASRTFFTKIKEELEYVPAQLNVLEYWQEKAVFDDAGEQTIVSAQRPVHPLGKCLASTSLLTYILVAKYADGLPLYRLEGILKRYGHGVSRTNMAHWMIRLEDVFKPLITLMRETQNAGHYVQVDETRMQVLKEDGYSAQSDQWIWVTRGGPPGQPSVLFEYDPSRAGKVPERLLEGFSGTLQADGYSGYGLVCKSQQVTVLAVGITAGVSS
jgi:transposase